MNGVLKSFTYTQAWGLNAGTGNMTTLGGGAAAGTEFAMTAGGNGIHGVVMTSRQKLDTGGGLSWELEFADNRIRLTWDYIKCVFNKVEIIAKQPGENPRVQQQRRYWHIYPNDWSNQLKTYTDKPHTAKEIFEKVFGSSSIQGGKGGLVTGGLTSGTLNSGSLSTSGLTTTGLVTGAGGGAGPGYSATEGGSTAAGTGGGWHWTFDPHPKLSDVVYDVDANTGMELGNFVQMILDRLGLLMTLGGQSHLKFTTKGEGSVPSLYSFSTKSLSVGDSISQSKTACEVIGDRNIYQDINITLEPDWQRAWEEFIFERDFLEAIDFTYGPYPNTPVGRAERAIKARSVTVWQFARAYPRIPEAQLIDIARWGDTTRNSLPAWFYINNIVYKAYRIPLSYQILGVPLKSLEIKENLLKEVDHNQDDGVMKYEDVGELYPEQKAYIIAKGQPLSQLIDPRKKEFVDPATMDRLRDQWMAVNQYRIDFKGKCIIFDEPIIIPDSGLSGLFVWRNANNDQVPDDHPSKFLVTPNLNAKIQPAPVKASIAFEARRYSKQFGQGIRRTSLYVGGLSQHVLLRDGQWSTEIKYDSTPQETADEKAAKACNGYIVKNQSYLAGSAERLGYAGTTLNGCIDRVTISLDKGGGLREEVDLTREKNPNYFDSERELERRRATEELFSGQRDLQEEIRMIRYEARLITAVSNGEDTKNVQNINDVPKTPIGNKNPGTVDVYPPATHAAGAVLWSKDNGDPGASGDSFEGVVIADNATAHEKKPVPVARQGTVPVNVTGPFFAGDRVYCPPGSTTAARGVSRHRHIGVVTETFNVLGATITVPVKLNVDVPPPLHPFQVYVERATADEVILKVAERSTCLRTEDWSDKVTIPNLTDNLDVTDNLQAVIHLTVWFDQNGDVTRAEVSKMLWDEYPTPWKVTGTGPSKAYEWHQVLAYLRPARNGENPDIYGSSTRTATVIEQCTTTHLFNVWMCMSDASNTKVKALMPWAGAVVRDDTSSSSSGSA